MNKELFVSSTPHETKVGLVEDDLLAEIYLERENEYTLAGSIYKGRVTRVLPGMQSAFVDIGLERDAFLYVSDFMDLEEHDEDLTESVPANRGVQDMRPQGESGSSAVSHEETDAAVAPAHSGFANGGNEGSQEAPPEQASAASGEAFGGRDSQDRDRGGWKGRRRRRGRREGRDRNDYRPAAAAAEGPTSRVQESKPSNPRQFGPPAGYEPILLPGESISKYRGKTPSAAADIRRFDEARSSRPERSDFEATSNQPQPAVASAFPEDEPVFADSAAGMETPAVGFESHPAEEEVALAEPAKESVTTSVDWNREFHRMDSASAVAAAAAPEAAHEIQEVIEAESLPESSAPPAEAQASPFAAPGTLEEETIEEEEADTVRYEQSSDDSYDEFEEETHAAGQPSGGPGVFSEVRETVDEIHMNSFAESGAAPAEAVTAESEEDSEDLELEEAQAEAEAMIEAEARGNGTVDARAEVRASTGTAGYTQRAPRQRPGWERRGGGRRGGGRRFPRRQSQEVPKISDLLKEGQEILVQIAKEPIGKKGARITSHIALPGRFLVYMPTVNHTGVSRKIASDEERQRLKRIVMSERENGHGGFIVRTAAQNASEEELRADIRFLKGLWNDIKNRAESSKPPALIYHDLNVVERVLRDQVTSDFSVIWVDTEAEYERILRFFNRFQPGLVKRVKLYTKETPLFEQFGLAEEMNKALKSKVWLKSGGYIVINQTEALVAIDINTGKYVGKTARLEDTIVKTNVDAVKEIVRQIRLRDLGGIIIIDFIDMDERRNRQRVMQALEEELRNDRAPSKVLQFNDFGLVAITRKRVKQSLERTIGAPCPYCQSTGYVKSVTTVGNEIYVEMRKIAKHLEHNDVMLRVNPDVAKELKANSGRLLNEMEELTKRTIIVKSDPALHQEQFDIN
ncbi:MAG TPA: Rne/Rng family ribonuclease [Candidatus Sulfotelmatobacter sp.]